MKEVYRLAKLIATIQNATASADENIFNCKKGKYIFSRNSIC